VKQYEGAAGSDGDSVRKGTSFADTPGFYCRDATK